MRILCAARTLALLGFVASLLTVPEEAAAQSGGKPGAAHKPASPSAAPAKNAPKPGKAPARPAAKPAPPPPRKGGKRALSRKPGSEAGEPDEAVRRVIAGTAGRMVRESPELRAMRELDLALFPSHAPSAGTPWIAEGSPLFDRGEPRVQASGMPPSTPLAEPAAERAPDLAWLHKLTMPDIPVRWDARVVRYLEFYRNNARGRSMVAGWIKKSGRYGGAIRRVLREQGVPEDVLWLALIESGFDPTIQSPAGAAGLWQFMPDGARIYGLTVDRWVDERLDPERSTVAAARYLSDLRQRFGTWELAFAAYNMGYGGLLASIRKYNTNDFWELSRVESGMPLETALYVPKIVAMAIVARNKAVFGCDDVELDAAVAFDKIAVSPAVPLRSVALAAGTSLEKVEELNPQLPASRTPPAGNQWTVRVPPGAAPKAAKSLPKFVEAEPRLERHTVRWGESLDDIAARSRVRRAELASVNGLRRDEILRPGTVLLLPAARVPAPKGSAPEPVDPSGKPIVVVPAQAFAYPDRTRVFYRVVAGDTLRDLGPLFGVTAEELCRWNALEGSAALHDGMTLQVFVPTGRAIPSNVVALAEKDAQILPAGSPAFFAHFEALRGRKRIEIAAKEGDTFRTLARRYGLTVAQLERINQRARSSALAPGEKVVVYVADSRAPDAGPKAPVRVAKAEEKPEEAVAVTSTVADDAKDAAKENDKDDSTHPAVLKAAPPSLLPPSPSPTPALLPGAPPPKPARP